MGTEMIIKTALFWSFAPIGLGFLIAALSVWLSVRAKRDNCISKTTGRVVGYSVAEHGESGVHLPVVEYEADNRKFRRKGPIYSFTTVNVSSPFIKENTCEYTTDIYAQNFKVKTRTNGFISVIRNPMTELFPLGSEVEVYYDPRKPKRAYILRLYENKAVITVFSILGAVFTAVALVAAFI